MHGFAGKKIGDVAAPLNTIVESYGCTLVEGVLSHQLKQFVVDGNKCILNRPNPEAKVEDGEFEENEVYALDILVSTGGLVLVFENAARQLIEECITRPSTLSIAMAASA